MPEQRPQCAIDAIGACIRASPRGLNPKAVVLQMQILRCYAIAVDKKIGVASVTGEGKRIQVLYERPHGIPDDIVAVFQPYIFDITAGLSLFQPCYKIGYRAFALAPANHVGFPDATLGGDCGMDAAPDDKGRWTGLSNFRGQRSCYRCQWREDAQPDKLRLEVLNNSGEQIQFVARGRIVIVYFPILKEDGVWLDSIHVFKQRMHCSHGEIPMVV